MVFVISITTGNGAFVTELGVRLDGSVTLQALLIIYFRVKCNGSYEVIG
jgi:hypothetical protein